MHKICAFLVPFSPDEGAERAAAEAEEVLLSIADENNWYTIADLRRNTRHRQRAARRLVVVLDDGWPLPEVSASLYDQSVFCCDADPEEAAIVLLGIHV